MLLLLLGKSQNCLQKPKKCLIHKILNWNCIEFSCLSHMKIVFFIWNILVPELYQIFARKFKFATLAKHYKTETFDGFFNIFDDDAFVPFHHWSWNFYLGCKSTNFQSTTASTSTKTESKVKDVIEGQSYQCQKLSLFADPWDLNRMILHLQCQRKGNLSEKLVNENKIESF